MGAESTDRGGRRRATVRLAVGAPGSIRRWLLDSLVLIFLATLLFMRVGFLARIAIFITVAVIVMAAFRVRSMAIGDEDEMRAGMRRESRDARRHPEPEEPKILLDEAEWERAQESLRLRELGFRDTSATPADAENGTVVQAQKR